MAAAPWPRPVTARPRGSPSGNPAGLTRLHRMGRKMVMVAGLLTNSVTMDTRMHASRVMAHGGRLLRVSIWCPIHVERPELCRPTWGQSEESRKNTFHWSLESRRSGTWGGWEEPPGRSPLICLPSSRQTGPNSNLDFVT